MYEADIPPIPGGFWAMMPFGCIRQWYIARRVRSRQSNQFARRQPSLRSPSRRLPQRIAGARQRPVGSVHVLVASLPSLPSDVGSAITTLPFDRLDAFASESAVARSKRCYKPSFEDRTEDGTKLTLVIRLFVSRFIPVKRRSRFYRIGFRYAA